VRHVRGICGWVDPAGGGEAGGPGTLGALVEGFDAGGPEAHRLEDGGFGLASTAEPIRVAARFHAAFAGRPRADGGMDAWLTRFAAEGVAALAGLSGAFAVAVVEPDGSLVLAADRSGTCPLWYQPIGDGVAFASDPRCLDRHPADGGGPEAQGLFHYAYFGVVPAPRAVKGGRRRLQPGEYVRVRNGELQAGRYWEMRFDERKDRAVADFETELWERLRDAVRDGVEDAGRVGAFLSGGIDSSTVVGLLAESLGSDATCYTIGFDEPGYNELGFAETAARHFGVEHHSYMVTPEDVVDAIPRIGEAYGEPFGNESAVAVYFCAKLAREHGVETLLAGDGGDELFGGNERYAKQGVFEFYGHLPRILRAVLEPVVNHFPAGDRIWPVRKARRYIEQASTPLPGRLDAYSPMERRGAETMFEPGFLARVDQDGPRAARRAEWARSAGASTLNRMLHIDMKFTLADNDLRKVVRMCEMAGVEVRFPFLHDALVEFSTRLPARQKVKGKHLRYFFRHAMRDFLPHDTLTKSKHGFGLPFGLWLRRNALLQEFARDRLASLRERGVYRPDHIDRVVRAHREEHAVYYGVEIWGFLMLEEWFRAHVDGRVAKGVR